MGGFIGNCETLRDRNCSYSAFYIGKYGKKAENSVFGPGTQKKFEI